MKTPTPKRSDIYKGKAKFCCIVLSVLVIACMVSLSSTMQVADAAPQHLSKAKKDGTGVGEGSNIQKGKTQSWAVKKSNNKHHAPIKNQKIGGTSKPASTYNCNCVIFRLDDVQDYWLDSIQNTVMDQFIAKNKPLDVGPILDYIGDDASVVDKVNSGYHAKLFEIFVHGWDHVDYSQLSLQDQTSTLKEAKNKTRVLFGVVPKVFVPPYDTFDSDTLAAMKRTEYKTISAADWADSYPEFVAIGKTKTADSYGRYHMPSTVEFVDFMPDGSSVRVSNDQLLADIDASIAVRGYAVVTLHAQDFRQKVNGNPIDVIDTAQIADLNSLIDSLGSKNISITTFGKVTSGQN